MRTWIFQGNPAVFDIEGYLAASSGLITWTVARYAEQISAGDTVYIWQSQGHDAARASNLEQSRAAWGGPGEWDEFFDRATSGVDPVRLIRLRKT
jgi:hypothetical protein